jgi:predicted esterase
LTIVSVDDIRPLFATLAALLAASSALADATEPRMRQLEFGAKRPALYEAPAPPSDAAREDSKKKPPKKSGRAVATTGKPLVVFLHGMCALPEWECPVFRGATSGAWLLCPPGPAACQGTGAMWTGTTRTLSRRVDAATRALTEREKTVDSARRALVGYSLGGPAALRVALAAPGRYQRLMFVNAGVTPSKAVLEKAGVTRVAFVAGEADGTAAKLRRASARLARVGVDARYFSMGKVGHYFDASSEERLREPLRWLTSEW